MENNNVQVVETKKWWQSKTVWVNIVAGTALIVQAVMGRDVLSPDIQATILAVINIVLRVVTKAPIV